MVSIFSIHFITNLSQNVLVKIFENRSIFGEDADKTLRFLGLLFWPTRFIFLSVHRLFRPPETSTSPAICVNSHTVVSLMHMQQANHNNDQHSAVVDSYYILTGLLADNSI